ncbi:MAG: DUF1501 domain-containing protein [Betaproteobacteria bacterium]|nr:MAG: DUF1501 domain-containing protein [Betaproteobacteria bacterium]
MKRRDFMRAGFAGGLALVNAKLWAAPGDAKLLVVMLRGAYDGSSLLVPYASDFYYRSRPSIAVPRPDSGDPNAAVALDSDWALNAAVKDSLLPLYKNKQAVLIPFSGSDDLSRSHFQAQDLMELGQGGGGALDYSSGYLNRLVEALSGSGSHSAASFTNNLTPVFKGAAQVPNVSLRGNMKDNLPSRQGELIASLYEGTKLSGLATAGMETRKIVAEALMNEMTESSRGAGAAIVFETRARAIAKLMRDKPAYSIGFVDVGGWDTHVDQGSAQGALAANLTGLAGGLSVFAQELRGLWRSTVIVVMSEFGRTFRENGSRGTDHGHGNTLWVLGGGISGGRIAGRQEAVSEANLFQNRDYQMLNDYRSVLAYLFARMYGFGGAALERVLPGAKADNYGFI